MNIFEVINLIILDNSNEFEKIEMFLKSNKTPIMISLLGALLHIILTNGTFLDAILKFISAFIGALLFAPAITEYYELGIKGNNLMVLISSLITYYLVKGILYEADIFSKNPKTYIFDIITRFKNSRNGNTDNY